MHAFSHELDQPQLDHIELFVGMAKMVVFWHERALGFRTIAYAGPETGVLDRVSYVLEKNGIRLVVTSAAHPSAYDILSFVDRHGNGVKHLAFTVDQVDAAFAEAVKRGAIPLGEPITQTDKNGSIRTARLKFLDGNELTLFDRTAYDGCFAPGYEAVQRAANHEDQGLRHIDHIAFGVYPNEMTRWTDYFTSLFGGTLLQTWDEEDVGSTVSGMRLAVWRAANRALTGVFVEPVKSRNPSQVQEYLEAFHGSGVQHVAFATDDIFATVATMRAAGVEFVAYPTTYYDNLRKAGRLPHALIDQLEEQCILCDKQGKAYLFQTFTKPFGDRPTFFYEIIQRRCNYEGFGQDNVRALFEAVEQDQARRGSLVTR
ncbi:4-hydroxyphenylpyruvate dioxygenase [Acanthopleuribacter pedis]|uniref:4-hydroxyphenylpyruvate dioxygenase n=1 Tax=Acanthopleuribacter pedis TaxID=442870 RepID=A0A8J7QFI0_9BACT|nr:4-hydroxyphenylpyruvate dioxygenase [Acanthopleuribacter pedis]MBO1317500.1 4-hydroxyphenylpyruvate dioxygenase [Acanthopleuribacter pedis]